MRPAVAAGMHASIVLEGVKGALGAPLLERHSVAVSRPHTARSWCERLARPIVAEIDRVQEEIATLKSG